MSETSIHNATEVDAVDTSKFDSVRIAGGRGPEYIRTYPRVHESHRDAKPIASICHGLHVLTAAPDAIVGRKASGLFTAEPEVALTDATYVKIGPKAALRGGNLTTDERWTALAAFIWEYLVLSRTEIFHNDVSRTAKQSWIVSFDG